MKKILIILASLFLITGAYSFARAEPVCENGIFAEQSAKFQENGAIVQQLNVDQIKNMTDKVGNPPDVEGDFEAYLVTSGPLAAVFVVQEGCTKARLGPSRAEAVDSLLGIIRAGDRV